MTAKDELMAAATADEIAQRLALVREVAGMNQVAFAQRAGIASNAWNNYERARKRISIDAAIALVATYQLTLDYIFLGDASNLPYKLATALEAVREARERS